MIVSRSVTVSRQVLVQIVKCGPGHGISIGSLGKYKEEEPVEGITVKGCTLKGTTNRVRIKTWPNEPRSITINDMKFEDITMDNMQNPIIIDQEYCPNNQCSKGSIKVSIKVLRELQQAKKELLLTYNGATVIARCTNVKPTITGKARAAVTVLRYKAK
ncbi:hypothetical protein ACSQ67_014145 [Phaseolus vulgaris]